MARAIGIDLGTTNSVAAVVSRGRPRVIPSATADVDWTPSLVARAEDGTFVVGREVESIAEARAVEAAHSVKRLMGRRFSDDEVQRMINERRFLYPVIEHPSHAGEIGIVLGGAILTPAEVSAQVLRTLKNDAEVDLGEPVGHAVITTPAYFRDPSNLATREAGRIAGLRVHHLMPEPTAAALAYALGEDATGTDTRHVLVYDFGGGTFDVSVLLAVPGTSLQVLAVDGDNFLGGDDIDWEITSRWDRELRAAYGVSILDGTGISEAGPYPALAIKWAIKLAARETKERLAGAAPSRTVTKPGLILRDDGTAIGPTMSLTRDALADIARPYVDRTFAVVERALATAHMSTADITDVVVVGGSTKLAGVLDQLRQMFPGAEVRNSINPMLVVGIGAAQQTRMAIPWNCPECGRVNDATVERCVGCGTEADRPTHDCEACGAIYGASDTSCPNPGCGTQITRPEAPVEVLSHTYKVRLVGGDWEPLFTKGTAISGVPTSPWILLHASRTGQRVDLPVAQDHDEPGMEPQVIAHFTVIDPPSDLVAGEPINVRLTLDMDRVSMADAQIRGRLYGTRRVEFGDRSTIAVDEEQDEEAERTPKADWYRFLASSSTMLPDNTINPGAREFASELKTASADLVEIADRIELAERANDAAEVERLTAEADAHIETELPIVPTLSLAMLMSVATEDLDARRDLQAGMEDVRQALATGDATDLQLAFQSLQEVMSSVTMPSGESANDLDANLLARYGQR